jgi:hypothetical protein
MINPETKLAEVLCHAQEFLDLAVQTADHGDREMYVRIVELYLKIGRELEIISDRKNTRRGTNVPT